ncbi:uncharacterized protein LOC133457679 [Cololabis saira]|uniref:uncharacterized protein LOC133457679 n=1 Tax=Cololabis saira TaxID=129043 RepID=UPI002AD39860|nr:uncharacterized protein LOC133457679 [Cololabis saira]
MDSGNRLLVQILSVVVFLLCNCSAFNSDGRNDGNCNLVSREGCNEIQHPHMYSPSVNQKDLDVYDSLWDNNKDVAIQTWETPFMQHMKHGDLQSDDYVNFLIQDINYLVKVTEMLEKMAEKVQSPEDLKNFFRGRYESYNSFAKLMLKQFNLNSVSEIKPIPAMKKYLEDYKAIMDNSKPIFFAVSLLPCSRLWLWLANELDIGYGNAYFIWKKNNMSGHPAKHYRKLLDDNLKTKEDKERADKIFRQQMENERDFFAAAPAA